MYGILYLLLFNVAAGFPEVEYLPEFHRQALHCAKEIARQYFEEDYPIVISDPRNTHINTIVNRLTNISVQSISISDLIIRELTCGISRSGIVLHGTETEIINTLPRGKPVQFIVILSDNNDDIVESLFELLYIFNFYYYERIRGSVFNDKFVIAFTKISDIAFKTVIQFVGDQLSTYKIFNVVLILPRTDNVHTDSTLQPSSSLISELYTWFPFKNYKHCHEFNGLTFLDRWISLPNGKFEYQRNLFPHKFPKVFNGCPLYYASVIKSAKSMEFEWYVLDIIFRSLNITLVDTTDFGNIDIFFSSQAINLINNIITFMKMETLNQLRFTFPHMFTELRWYVPCPKPNIIHGKFYKVFDASLWLLFFVTCVLFSVVIFLMRKSLVDEYASYQNISYTSYCVWAVATSVSVPEMPKTTRLRIVFIVMIGYSFAMSTVFQSFFTSYLTEPGFEKQLSSLDELHKEGFRLFGQANILMAWFVNFTNFNSTKSLANMLSVFDVSEFSIEDFLNITKSAVITSDLDMKLKLGTHKGNIKPCSFLFSTHGFYSANIFYSCVYYKAINTRILRLFEAGLFLKLLDMYKDSNNQDVLNITDIGHKMKKDQDLKYSTFNTKHLSVFIFIYLAGNAISIIVFIAEIIFFKLKSFK
ncbi:hypothetical protein L9F63_003635 [Diploptera punctata]|uniref:Uncharacterized protein n=1 Tax=Diploptera punctata TaxID=6984 RepID=A0AAD7ZKH8_DIPPU|nr:hypothetical protein L9F63_003635 [Diploptera punctata]